MDKVGIAIFIVIGFGINYGVQAWAYFSGYVHYNNMQPEGMIMFYSLSLAPFLGALIAGRVSKMPPPERAKILPLHFGRAIAIALLMAVLCMGGAAMQGVLGVVTPDWGVRELVKVMPSPEELGLEDEISSSLLLGAGIMLTFVLSLLFWIPLAIPTEYAWRGFLLPRLMPLGRFTGYLLTGVLWGLWFAPAALNKFLSEVPFSTLSRVVLLCVALTFILGEVARRTKSLFLCAAILGSLFAQADFLKYVLPIPEPPLGGRIGLVNIGVWVILAIALYIWPDKEKKSDASTDEEDGVATEAA